MARFLLGWELGANRGHIERLSAIANRLASDGHSVAVALQRIDGGRGGFADGVELWQAPVWPRLLVNVSGIGGSRAASMGDILVRLGLDRAETLAALIGGWDSILRAVRPDVVIADFAPALLCAARGRVPSIGAGTGFERVPAHMAEFPSLGGGAKAYDESTTLAAANAGLRLAGRAPVAALPALMGADVSLAGVFAELDVYSRWRTEPVIAPNIAQPLPPVAGGGGDELFVYGFERMSAESELWPGLAASGLKVRVHVPNAPAPLVEAITRAGLMFEPEPLPFAEIVRRSALVASHGGHGFVCSALVAGLPQVVVHYDLEKRGYGAGVRKAGLGGEVALGAIKAAPFAESLRRIFDDAGLRDRARKAAVSFRERATPSFTDVTVEAALRIAS